MKRFVIKLLNMLLLSMIILIVGCSTTRKVLKFDTHAVINITTAVNVNPDADGRPSPIRLSLYQLSEDERFRAGSFIELYRQPEKVLGDSALDQLHYRALLPGESNEIAVKLKSESRYIGVLAEYVEFNQARTKLVLEVDPHQKNHYRIYLAENGLLRDLD